MDENQKSLVVHFLTEFIIGVLAWASLLFCYGLENSKYHFNYFQHGYSYSIVFFLHAGYGRVKRKYGKNLLLVFISF